MTSSVAAAVVVVVVVEVAVVTAESVRMDSSADGDSSSLIHVWGI